MRKFITVLMILIMMCLITTASAYVKTDKPDGYITTGGLIIDSNVYVGTWEQTYLQILNNHSSMIHAYQDRTLKFILNSIRVQVPCKPVSLVDITGDFIPELIFVEAATDRRADLYIYSSDGTNTKCVLYVPAISRLDYDVISLGYDIYLSADDGGTLVIEYYEYEWPWVLQMKQTASGLFTLRTYLRARYDSGNADDNEFIRNWSMITYDEYAALQQAMRNGRTKSISNYHAMDDITHYGFTLDWEGAVYAISGNSTIVVPTQAPSSYGNKIYGLTIMDLATRKGPGTQYDGGGTYKVKDQYIQVLARAYDKRNSIWWVKCVIPYHGEERILWTGYKRFDRNTLPLEIIPVEEW